MSKEVLPGKIQICPHCGNNIYACPTEDSFLTKVQMAKILQVTVRTLENYMMQGWIPYIRIGRTVRFRLKDVNAHLDERQNLNT